MEILEGALLKTRKNWISLPGSQAMIHLKKVAKLQPFSKRTATRCSRFERFE